MKRKPYRRPKLTVYGNVRDITRAGPRMGQTNDSITGMNKTG
jgi:hypothetical protein